VAVRLDLAEIRFGRFWLEGLAARSFSLEQPAQGAEHVLQITRTDQVAALLSRWVQ
jgi:hypothetical protein